MSDDIVTRLRENCDETDCVNVRSIALVKCDNCEAADEIERLRQTISGLIIVGDALAREIEIGGKCACRREWTCHKCQAVEAWRSAREQ